jgi:peptide/nickel transport system substrate-binding protein
MHDAPASLDPADPAQAGSLARRNLGVLLFDTLTSLDDLGRIRPALAVTWEDEPGHQRWQFHLRRGVAFDDGTPLTPVAVAASLRSTNPSWTIRALDDSVTIELKAPNPSLAAELALPRNSILKRLPEKLSGTGPFRVSDWQPGEKLVLAANEDYWGGRPFLNSVEIEFGKSWHDQMVSLELGKADVIELPPDQARRVKMEGRRVSQSAPIELMALVFLRDVQTPQEAKLRNALELSVDRPSIKNVLLQGEGDSAGGLLPNWITGYEFLFPDEFDMQKAQQERAEVPYAPSLTLLYHPADPLARLVAERIALNARDAGINLSTTSAGSADLRLLRLPILSSNPGLALATVAVSLGLPQAALGTETPGELYQSENTLLQTHRVIPLFHLPVNYGLSQGVQNWKDLRTGTWNLGDVWLSAEKP